jgi:hypothetical protein
VLHMLEERRRERLPTTCVDGTERSEDGEASRSFVSDEHGKAHSLPFVLGGWFDTEVDIEAAAFSAL